METISSFIDKIHALIAKDHFQEAIRETQSLLKGSPLFDELILQSARYSDIMKQMRLGLIDFQDSTTEKNKIRYALIDIVRELEENTSENTPLRTEVEYYFKSKEANFSNRTVITGNENINLQNISGSLIKIQTGNTTNQNADKIYNIDKIDKADFS